MNLDQKIKLYLQAYKIEHLLDVDDTERLIKKSLRIRITRLVQILFELDPYRENVGQIDERKVNLFQNDLQKAMKGLHIKPSLLEKYIVDIIKYIKLENQLREGVFSASSDLKHFYYYKSSGVRLVRSIIYGKVEKLRTRSSSEWSNFDLLRAMRDDIDMIKEDKIRLRVNRFLCAIAHQGHAETINDYRHFIQNKLIKNNPHVQKDSMSVDISDWIQQEANEILGFFRDIQKSEKILGQEDLAHFMQRQSMS